VARLDCHEPRAKQNLSRTRNSHSAFSHTFVSLSAKKTMKQKHRAAENIPGLIYTHLATQRVVGEQFIAEHGLCYIISGNLKVVDAGETRIYNPGDILFYRKNFLSRFTKQPEEKREFRSVTVVFDRDSLTAFAEQYGVAYEEPFPRNSAVLKLDNDILLENYFKTLFPYFDAALPEHLINLKRQEALMILLQVNPALKNILFHFEMPDKIDLEAFMEQHFRFNVELKRFAWLSGRSLATFKRDFEKVFHTTPGRWLQQRRLEEAHYLIREKSRRPSDVYQEVGFESLAHFSYAFKQQYGITPSGIQ
jgi:AraC-like DNA-binding protein